MLHVEIRINNGPVIGTLNIRRLHPHKIKTGKEIGTYSWFIHTAGSQKPLSSTEDELIAHVYDDGPWVLIQKTLSMIMENHYEDPS